MINIKKIGTTHIEIIETNKSNNFKVCLPIKDIVFKYSEDQYSDKMVISTSGHFYVEITALHNDKEDMENIKKTYDFLIKIIKES